MKRNIAYSFWFEESGPKRLIDYLGEDRVMFETDFPHTTKLYPATSVKQPTPISRSRPVTLTMAAARARSLG